MNRILMTALAALLATPAAAEIYRWTDDAGRVHFGENPPAGVTAETVRGAPPPASSGDTVSAEGAESADAASGDDSAGAPGADEDASASTDSEELQAACASVRQNAEVFADESVRRVRGEDGEVMILTPEERETRLAEAEAFLDEHC